LKQGESGVSDQQKIRQVVQRLGKYNKEIDFYNPVYIDNDLHDYLQYYQLLFQNVDYYFGKLNMSDLKIMMQVYAPKECRGTIYLLHGYFDHVGTLNHLILFLLEKNYRIVTYDLKGHGLSSGPAAVIGSFEEYVQTFEAVITKTKDIYSGPCALIAHSTGAAVAVDYLLRSNTYCFNKVILAAPLVRSYLWPLTKIGYYMFNPFLNEVKRKYRLNSNNKDHQIFIKQDPLQYDGIPLTWLKALINWNAAIQTYSASKIELFIIQGEKDQTVNWKYNIPFLAKKFPNALLSLIKQGRHQLFNEREDIQQEVFHAIETYLMKEIK
jgi:alpha-beta hydrolase superfamily lysophospholipase